MVENGRWIQIVKNTCIVEFKAKLKLDGRSKDLKKKQIYFNLI